MKICSVEECEGMHYAKGYCCAHYSRLRRSGWLERPNSLARFEQYVDRNSGIIPAHVKHLGQCHIWTGAKTPNGRYGTFWLDGAPTTAHRAALLITGISIPKGHEVDHLCVNTLCVNPAHLQPVTPSVNAQRRIAFYAISGNKGGSE